MAAAEPLAGAVPGRVAACLLAAGRGQTSIARRRLASQAVAIGRLSCRATGRASAVDRVSCPVVGLVWVIGQASCLPPDRVLGLAIGRPLPPPCPLVRTSAVGPESVAGQGSYPAADPGSAAGQANDLEPDNVPAAVIGLPLPPRCLRPAPTWAAGSRQSRTGHFDPASRRRRRRCRPRCGPRKPRRRSPGHAAGVRRSAAWHQSASRGPHPPGAAASLARSTGGRRPAGPAACTGLESGSPGLATAPQRRPRGLAIPS